MDLEQVKYIGELVVLGFGGLTIAVNAIAAVTPSNRDNVWGERLRWVNEKLQVFALPFLRARKAKDKVEAKKV